MNFGQRDKNKPHKTILLVGETGTGKTKLINTMINYMLGVKREDKVWFEITDDQSNETSAHSQTSIIAVHGVYLQESPTDLTIIDTPGYGDTHAELDEQIAVSFFSLSKPEDGIHAVDAVCLVINANQNRLSDRQIYIFDAVQSIFGRDIAENIVLLFTHSTGAPPRNALMAVKEAQIKCAVNEQKNQPVFFLFDNYQSDAHDEEYETIQEQSWNLSFRGMTGLFEFLNTIKPKSLKMTQDVLQQRNQLEIKISNLKSHVQLIKLKQNELKQPQEALEKSKCYVQSNKNFEYEVEVPYKEKVDIDRSVDEAAMCCTVCEENCHYPGCWWTSDVSLCSVMRKNHCTVCSNKCHYSKHIKTPKIYVTRTKKEKRTNEDLKKKYDEKIKTNESAIKKLEEELRELEKEKMRSVFEAFYCVDILQFIALNADSLNTLQHVDYLMEKLKDINEPEKVKKVEDIKKRADGKYRALRFIKRC
nr:immune-associated nucleotide-binding protein 10-like [Danio rerio]|eukprot:XP_021325914.1 immune-associated nucleotide-binding protein 10-like [Danio rerio]